MRIRSYTQRDHIVQSFYGLEKIHKLKPGQGIDDLPLLSIISNIGTATYGEEKYLAKLFSPLSCSEYTVTSADDLANVLKRENVHEDCEFVSFDVFS